MLEKFNGPLRLNPINPRYFTDNTGESIYLAGSHTWAVMQEMWPENEPRHNMDYSGFIQMMEDNNHNFLRFWQFALMSKGCPCSKNSIEYDPLPYLRVGTELANDGMPKFDLTQFNEEYFDRIRQRVIEAGEHGIYVSIMMFEAWSIKWAKPEQQPWVCHVYNPCNNVNNITDNPQYPNGNYWGVYTLNCPQINEVQKEFVKKIIDTVNDLDNVLYEVCNEIPFTDESLEWQKYMCAFIRNYEKTLPQQHMIGITAEGGDQLNEDLFSTNADWISPSNGLSFEYRYNPPIADGKKVVLNDTDHLWGHGCEVSWIWKSFTRGMNVLFMDPWEPFPGDLDWWQDGDISKNSRYYYAWDDMRRNLGYTKVLSTCFNMNNLVPDMAFCTSTYALAYKNQQYICYFPSGGFEGLYLKGTDGEFKVEWFEPKTGITHKGETIKGLERVSIKAPFDGPSVLLMFKDRKYSSRKRAIYYSGV